MLDAPQRRLDRPVRAARRAGRDDGEVGLLHPPGHQRLAEERRGRLGLARPGSRRRCRGPAGGPAAAACRWTWRTPPAGRPACGRDPPALAGQARRLVERQDRRRPRRSPASGRRRRLRRERSRAPLPLDGEGSRVAGCWWRAPRDVAPPWRSPALAHTSPQGEGRSAPFILAASGPQRRPALQPLLDPRLGALAFRGVEGPPLHAVGEVVLAGEAFLGVGVVLRSPCRSRAPSSAGSGALRMWAGGISEPVSLAVRAARAEGRVDGVGLGRGGHVHADLGQRQLALGLAQEVVGVLGGDRPASATVGSASPMSSLASRTSRRAMNSGSSPPSSIRASQ